MKHNYAILILLVLLSNNLFSQQHKTDTRIQILKEDESNFYKSDQITNLDLIEALELSGISINKYDLGKFDKKYKFTILVDEYKAGKILKSDTIFNFDNEYVYFVEGKQNYFTDYIDQLKVFAKIIDTTLTFQFAAYGISFPYVIHFKKYTKESNYYFRSYQDTKWSLNEKIPLLIYASSWKDEKGGFQRFCGVANLSRNNAKTDELLSYSPHYYMISYIIKEI